MELREPSPRVRELIREAAWIALNPSKDWLDELDRATLAAYPAIADDPALAAVISRSNRANLVHFAAANLRNPGAPVPPNLGAEQLRMARDLVRCDMDALALEVYRIGHNFALRRWTEIVFGLTSDPHELRELLDGPVRSANEFVDATLAGLAAQMEQEHDELTRNIRAQRRRLVETILAGDTISREQAETQLGYSLDRLQTAAIIWSDEPGGNYEELDRAAESFSAAIGCSRFLTVVPHAATRWVWGKDAALDNRKLHHVLDDAPKARLAIGSTAAGVDGFRKSHKDALFAQRALARLRSSQRVAFFADIEMVALLTHNVEDANSFIDSTLGEFRMSSADIRRTLLTFISQQCNASRAAKVLYIHRNTLLHRLEVAQRLLPCPLEENTINVAVALQVLEWHGNESADSWQTTTEQPNTA